MNDWKSSSPRWFKAGERRQELLIVSNIHRWESHWDARLFKSRRCGGRNCELCRVGSPKIARFVCIATDDRGTDWMLEFRTRHERTLEAMHAGASGAAGSRVCVRKEGKAVNSPVSIEFLDREYVMCRDITRLVATLGEPAMLADDGHGLGAGALGERLSPESIPVAESSNEGSRNDLDETNLSHERESSTQPIQSRREAAP